MARSRGFGLEQRRGARDDGALGSRAHFEQQVDARHLTGPDGDSLADVLLESRVFGRQPVGAGREIGHVVGAFRCSTASETKAVDWLTAVILAPVRIAPVESVILQTSVAVPAVCACSATAPEAKRTSGPTMGHPPPSGLPLNDTQRTSWKP